MSDATPHLDSDNLAIREADKHRSQNAKAYAERAVAEFWRKMSYDNCTTARDALWSAWLDHVRVLETRAASPGVEAWEDGPIKPPVPAPDNALRKAVFDMAFGKNRPSEVNPAPVTPAPNGERQPLVPRHLGDKYRC